MDQRGPSHPAPMPPVSGTDRQTGLSQAEAARLLQRFGPNTLEGKKESAVLKLLGYFWGPIPWMIEAAAMLSALARHWPDFWIIMTLLVFNAGIGFWQEYTAGNAVEALKEQLALKARVLRDGIWRQINAALLVPGDIIRIRLGDIIPADAELVEGDYLSVDQSALTGESLPVTKRCGDRVFSGTIAKQGEVVAAVTATGKRTRFGRTAGLVEQAKTISHFQKAVLSIGDYLIYVSLTLVASLMLVQLFRHAPWLELVQFALILTVASIPVAMPAVLSMTMALGAMALSRRKAIVTRLESIEEMAGMDVLCSDKTGTLTQNKLTLGEIETFAASDAQSLLLMAALASREENRDAIDDAIFQGLHDRSILGRYQQKAFTPFDPVRKRTEACVHGPGGQTLWVSKGAPQVIMDLCRLSGETLRQARDTVERFAGQGYRALGVAHKEPNDEGWRFDGLLSLYDPPRADSAQTIAAARQHGVDVKMVTGDNLAIARQIASKLKLGAHILDADTLTRRGASETGGLEADLVEKADGFAQVFPEHKFRIVKLLQDRRHIVGMTGDGVNDAPALKQADVGIAVSGASDAARAAADLVLTAPGLSVIINAIEEARQIFERMNSYAIYRISETLRIMFFVVLSMIFFDFYPITAIMIILLALLNDLPIMTIAYDRTPLSRTPVRWNMQKVITVATAMGLVGIIGSFGMLLLARDWLHLDTPQIQTYVFLKMAVAGHLVLFVARTKGHFWVRPFPAPIMIWASALTQATSTLLAAYGFGLITPITWPEIALIWGYSITSSFVTDVVKVHVYKHLEQRTPRHAALLGRIKRPLYAKNLRKNARNAIRNP